jgi:hypothetical protein
MLMPISAEIGMFGTPQREHDERYRYSDEWLTLMKPLQKPYPLIMNAVLESESRIRMEMPVDLSV